MGVFFKRMLQAVVVQRLFKSVLRFISKRT